MVPTRVVVGQSKTTLTTRRDVHVVDGVAPRLEASLDLQMSQTTQVGINLRTPMHNTINVASHDHKTDESSTTDQKCGRS